MSSTHRRAADAVDLSGTTALVTGATSGIGLACAQRLASAGAKVTVLGRDRVTVGRVADAIGRQARVVDLGAPEALDGLADLTADIVVTTPACSWWRPCTSSRQVRALTQLRTVRPTRWNSLTSE
jgi:3-hydroxybutyrate dehydrogenase